MRQAATRLLCLTTQICIGMSNSNLNKPVTRSIRFGEPSGRTSADFLNLEAHSETMQRKIEGI